MCERERERQSEREREDPLKVHTFQSLLVLKSNNLTKEKKKKINLGGKQEKQQENWVFGYFFPLPCICRLLIQEPKLPFGKKIFFPLCLGQVGVVTVSIERKD